MFFHQDIWIILYDIKENVEKQPMLKESFETFLDLLHDPDPRHTTDFHQVLPAVFAWSCLLRDRHKVTAENI